MTNNVSHSGQSKLDGLSELYDDTAGWLAAVARKKFGVPEDDVNSLVQDVFLSFARSAETIREPRKWLVAAICNASRSYWRRKLREEGRSSEVPLESLEGSSCPEEAIALELSIATMLSYLQEQCRDTLRMHYFEGRTAPEIALALMISPAYAEKLIHKCLRRAREICNKLSVRL